MKPFRIGMFGGGTVGGGVYELIMNKQTVQTARPLQICKICVRDVNKPRDYQIQSTVTEFCQNPDDILKDESIDCVVEVMGGTGLAKSVILQALSAGKSVVTANKAVVAESLEELQGAVQKNKEKNVVLAYEAAVCGGIPIIQTLLSSYSGDVVQSVQGICNGTTNFMLCRMEEGDDYQTVLRQAQDLGYAEADPTADVEGLDVRAKIAILAKLAFGTTVPVADIPCAGITQITTADFQYAAANESTIKLVGTAQKRSSDQARSSLLSVYVSPVMVSKQHLLATAKGAGNVVLMDSANMGVCSYAGPGAGRFPTANSVVADIVRVANGQAASNPFPPATDKSKMILDQDYTSEFYVRIPAESDSIVRDVGQVAVKCGMKVRSLQQLDQDVCLTVDKCKLSQVQAFCHDLEGRTEPLYMPILAAEDK